MIALHLRPRARRRRRGRRCRRLARSGIYSNAHACRAPEDDCCASRPPRSARTCPRCRPTSATRSAGSSTRRAIMDALFLRQVWAGNDAMLQDLARLAAAPAGPRASRSAAARLHYFLINKGPWDRLDHNRAVRARRARRSRSGELLSGRRHQGRSPDVDRRRCRATRRRPPPASSRRSAASDDHFVAVPYSIEYQGELARAARSAARGGAAHRASRR